MNWETLQKANESIRTTNIKGKDYAEVPQRIKAFRMVYPDGFITTELLSDVDGVCHFKASCGYYYDTRPVVLGTGHAYERESSSFINKTSYIENCETSAVGRALGMAGFGIDTSVASYEEVANAIAQQSSEKPTPDLDYTQEVTPADYRKAKEEMITDAQVDAIMKAAEKFPELAQHIADKYGGLPKMTKAQATKLLGQLAKKEART